MKQHIRCGCISNCPFLHVALTHSQILKNYLNGWCELVNNTGNKDGHKCFPLTFWVILIFKYNENENFPKVKLKCNTYIMKPKNTPYTCVN